MASLGCSDRLFSCTCHRPLSLTRSRPRLRHPPYRTIKFKFCAGPPGQPLHANASDQEQAVDAVAAMDEPVASSVPRSEEWELDFSSRPLVDERGKKVWELLICSPDRSFEYSEYFPNNKINSKELASSIQRVVSQEGAEPPRLAKFFRGQMATIISRALNELDINPVPSRRLENVYKKDVRYSEKAKNLFMLDLDAPVELEDALRGEAWNFVQLPLSTVLNETKDIDKGDIFGAKIPLGPTGLGDLPMDTLIPGVSVYSRRAEALAGWTNGLEISNITADVDRASLILETGVSQRWKYAAYARSNETTALAQGWEQAKQAARGLHFLAIQDDPDAESCTGLWLLLATKSAV